MSQQTQAQCDFKSQLQYDTRAESTPAPSSHSPAGLEHEFGEGISQPGFEADVDDEVESGSDGDEEDDDGIDDAVKSVVA